MTWAEHAACIRVKVNAYTISVEELKEKRHGQSMQHALE
jgi:hypothetical protein